MSSFQKIALSVVVALLLVNHAAVYCFAGDAKIDQIFNFTPQPNVTYTPIYQPTESRGTLFLWSPNGPTGGPDLDAPLVTDRPDFTEASSTVGVGVAQIEFGYTFTSNSDDGTSIRSHSMGEFLLRYGIVADWLELRVGLSPVQERTVGFPCEGPIPPPPGSPPVDRTTTGTEDLYLGLKIAITPQDGWLPEMAIIPQMTVPTGSEHFSNDETLLGINWIYGWEINDFISTTGSTQVNRAIDGGTYVLIMNGHNPGRSPTH